MDKKHAASILLLLFSSVSFAHAEPQNVWVKLGIPEPLSVLYVAAAIIALAVLASVIFLKSMGDNAKKAAFLIISVPTVIATLYIAGATVYLNLNSETGGPVHWHADYQVWACGKEYQLKDPTGFESFIGIPLIHEHNDERIHAEGVPLNKSELSLHDYFEATGGDMGRDYLIFSTTEGDKFWKNGDRCNGKSAQLQAFLYKIINPGDTRKWVYEQVKLGPDDAYNYIMSPYQYVPPGDCIIIEFDAPKPRTERLCTSYQIAIEKGELKEKS